MTEYLYVWWRTEGMIDETALGYVAHYCSPLPWANFTYPQLYAISLEKEGAVKNNLKKNKKSK